MWVNVFDVEEAAKTGRQVKRFAGKEKVKVYSWQEDQAFPVKYAKKEVLGYFLKDAGWGKLLVDEEGGSWC